MMLLISLVLAIIPLLGIAFVVLNGLIFTVDGLFLSLILAAMSGILLLNVLLELKKGHSGEAGSGSGSGSSPTRRSTAGGGAVQRGRVENVQFYEGLVGQPNKSIVTLSNGSAPSRMVVLEGDVRNALPVGQKVEFTLRKEGETNVLLNVNYA
jgi:hypothetical protein